jgi:hypothetical protein
VFIFGSVRFLSKKNNQTDFFLKTETGSNRPVSVRFFRTKTGSNRFDLVLARFGSVFFPVFSVRVRFGSFFSVPSLKNRNRTEPVGFFKILIGLIGFFHGSVFSVIFFSGFLGLIDFLIFLNTSSYKSYTMF